MGDVVTGKVETESMMQPSPGICKVLAVKREQVNVKGNGYPLGEEGTRAIIYHVYMFCRAKLYKETGNEIVMSSVQCPIVCRELLLGSLL